MTAIFWTSLFVVFYTFLGYGILLYFLVRVRRLFRGKRLAPDVDDAGLPGCTLIVAAYNEEDFIAEKIANTLSLNYPPEKISYLFVTDGSDDRTPEIVAQYPQIRLMHEAARNGKIAAMHRAVEQTDTEIIIFTDANTILNRDALKNIGRHYTDPATGAVAGEKRIRQNDKDDASAAGEGFYWKYESALKKWDSELYSVVGAAGELFSVRRSLYRPVPGNSILDDFMVSMLIAMQGYRIVYEPDAYASETASENVSEELKRKIRIAAGGMQSVVWLAGLFNIFRYGVLSFQYISHRVLRWTITPLLLIILFILIIPLAVEHGGIYCLLLAAQLLFYLLALAGMVLENRQIRVKALFIPYYFCVMNYAVLAGLIRYFGKQQSVKWERAKRKG